MQKGVRMHFIKSVYKWFFHIGSWTILCMRIALKHCKTLQ